MFCEPLKLLLLLITLSSLHHCRFVCSY
jgi:hypothetical protein